MARPSDSHRVLQWQKRIDAADKMFKDWASKYKCDILEEYWKGHQWRDESEDLAQQKYVINEVFASVETRKPSLLFFYPRLKVAGRPAHADDDASLVHERAQLIEDTVNTFIINPEVGFKEEVMAGIHESHFYFTVVEVGYTADFIDNPNAGKPVLKEDGDDPILDRDGKTIAQPDRIPVNEMLFVKQIPAETWRVSVSDKRRTGQNDWVGYYEWHYPEDIARNPQYRNNKNLKVSGSIQMAYREQHTTPEETKSRSGMVKIWKLWDLRTKTRYVIAEGNDKFLLEKPYRFLPFADLRPLKMRKGWYPLPVVFNWLHPQNELNETREMQRIHRRRFLRKFLAKRGRITPEELRKLEEPVDGIYVWAEADNAVEAITDAPLDAAVVRNIPATKEDFIEISGVSGEARQVAESETATQANIIDMRGRIRESYGRNQVGDWLAEIGRLMIETIKDSMALPFWIRINVDTQAQNAWQEALRVTSLWKQITSRDLGETAYDVAVDVESLSPVAQEAERQSWNQVLALLSNPGLVMLMATSPTILRKTLRLYGIVAEREIAEIGRVVAMIASNIAMQASAPKGQAGATGPGPTPGNDEIVQQLMAQLPQPNGGGFA